MIRPPADRPLRVLEWVRFPNGIWNLPRELAANIAAAVADVAQVTVMSPATRREAEDLLPDADVVLGFAVRGDVRCELAGQVPDAAREAHPLEHAQGTVDRRADHGPRWCHSCRDGPSATARSPPGGARTRIHAPTRALLSPRLPISLPRPHRDLFDSPRGTR